MRQDILLYGTANDLFNSHLLMLKYCAVSMHTLWATAAPSFATAFSW
jgi:hypothetical protein